jgi:tetratricopeptide (TPR) repeat protein
MSTLLIRVLLKNERGACVQNNREKLQRASTLAASGKFAEFVVLCTQMAEGADLASLLDTGALLSSYGFLSEARTCYEQAQALAQNDLRATINLANLARDAGEHAEARRLYAQLLQALPNHPVIRRNALVKLRDTHLLDDPPLHCQTTKGHPLT